MTWSSILASMYPKMVLSSSEWIILMSIPISSSPAGRMPRPGARLAAAGVGDVDAAETPERPVPPSSLQAPSMSVKPRSSGARFLWPAQMAVRSRFCCGNWTASRFGEMPWDAFMGGPVRCIRDSWTLSALHGEPSTMRAICLDPRAGAYLAPVGCMLKLSVRMPDKKACVYMKGAENCGFYVKGGLCAGWILRVLAELHAGCICHLSCADHAYLWCIDCGFFKSQCSA